MSGTTFQIKYKTQGSSHWQLSEPISLPYTQLDIVNLEESTDYSIVGIAREGAERISESSPLTFTTDSRRRISHINPEKLRNAAWFIAVLMALAISLLIITTMCYIAQKRHRIGLYSVKDQFASNPRYSSVRSGSSGGDTIDYFLDDTEEHKRIRSKISIMYSA
uniref:Fibronectin type-III domain-containing protein n=1 Tax=Ditylenchus dipsaci TaxID=166011 RepID=A0A915CPP1_9BILA